MKKLSRRAVLRGIGATVALPWLEAMAPAKSMLPSNWSSQPVAAAPKRLAFMYTPNGVIGQKWFPKKLAGSKLELSESLEPLKEVQDELVVISGLKRVHISGEPHAQAASCWLTSSLPTERPDGATSINRTLDQVIASQIGNATPFRSVELSCNSFTNNMEPKLFDAISWYGPGHDAKSENNPSRVFARLFGKSDSLNRSVLDTVLEDAERLHHRLGKNDRQKLEEYLESIRSIENRLDKQAAGLNRLPPIKMEVPEKIPTNRGEYIRMMGDLMVLALKTDQTRIASLMVGPERWQTPQLYDGVFDKPVNHHEMTHDDAFDDMVAKIDRFHSEQLAYVIKRMKAEREGERTLLDNTFLVYGSGIGDGNSHSYEELPMIIAGSGGLDLEKNRHVACRKGTPLANLWLTLADQMGVELERFADSTGKLDRFVS